MASSKVGTYVVSGKNRPWLATPATSNVPKTRRTKQPLEVINPIFDECAQLTQDPKWVILFSQAALGKMPKAFMYRDGSITYKKGTKVQRLLVPESPVEALSACIEFFGKTANITSPLDMQKAKQDYESSIKDTKSIFECDWTELKNGNMRKLILCSYVSHLKHKYALNEEEAKQLTSTINLGFTLGCFQDDHVSFDNGKIEEIDGLVFNAEKRFFTIDAEFHCKTSKASARSKEATGPHKTSFLFQWNKVIEKTNRKRGLPLKQMEFVDEPDDDDDQDGTEPPTHTQTSI